MAAAEEKNVNELSAGRRRRRRALCKCIPSAHNNVYARENARERDRKVPVHGNGFLNGRERTGRHVILYR